jgi:hypothetical protein
MDGAREIVAANFRNVEKAAESFITLAGRASSASVTDGGPGNAIASDTPVTETAVLASFVRFIEITCMVFFRAVENVIDGTFSASLKQCLDRMLESGYISDSGIWTEMADTASIALRVSSADERNAILSRIIGRYAAVTEVFIAEMRNRLDPDRS